MVKVGLKRVVTEFQGTQLNQEINFNAIKVKTTKNEVLTHYNRRQIHATTTLGKKVGRKYSRSIIHFLLLNFIE